MDAEPLISPEGGAAALKATSYNAPSTLQGSQPLGWSGDERSPPHVACLGSDRDYKGKPWGRSQEEGSSWDPSGGRMLLR